MTSRGETPELRADVRPALEQVLGQGRVRMQVSLASMTTFRTGGPADWLVEAREPEDIVAAIAAGRQLEIPVTVLGGGSNVLVAEGGVRGLVIRLRHGRVGARDACTVRAEAGVTLNGLVRWMVSRGLSGLERWAGTPGTVGGAVHGNAHFRGCLIGDQIRAVGVVDLRGRTTTVEAGAMGFGYDRSRLQQTGETVLWADFAVGTATPSVLRDRARESLTYRKRTQPLSSRSAGCIFRNPDPIADAVPEGVPPSAGALVDRAGLKGASVGHARVSALHGNFIVSDGQAAPRDIRALIEQCRQTVYERFGVRLREEIRYLGEF